MMNQEIVDKLFKIADLLEAQGASPFRVNAYRNAANVVDSLNLPVSEIVERKGIDGLLVLPGIGEGIARSIVEYVVMGRMSRLESLQGGHDPVVLFETIPGIGPTLAHRIIEKLHNVPGTGWWCIFMMMKSQHTVVTETRGVLIGKRVVRGREAECREYYKSSGQL